MSKATLCREVKRLREERGLDIYDPDFLKKYEEADSYCPTRNMIRDEIRMGAVGERTYLSLDSHQLQNVVKMNMSIEDVELFKEFLEFKQQQE